VDFREAAASSANSVLKKLKASRSGLGSREALARRKKYGANVIHAKKVTFWQILGRQFRSALIYLLIIAGAISLALRQAWDAAAIIAVLVLNAVLGVVQEYRDQRAVEKLRLFMRFSAFVLRDKKVVRIDREELVPGDVVRLAAGDMVPADLRLLQANNLEIVEEPLTGEPFTVEKTSKTLSGNLGEIFDAKNITFMQTRVVSGTGWGVVFAIGPATQIGQVASLAYAPERVTLFEKNSRALSRFLIWIVILALIAVVAVNIILKQGRLDVTELLLFAVAIAIAILPEPLPAITALALARSGLALAKKGVIVKRLSAIEDVGNIEVVCADKTGTLTENKLKIVDVFGADVTKAIFLAACAIPQENLLKLVHADPFDRAIYEKLDSSLRTKIEKIKKLWERPFDPVEKSNASVVEVDGRPILVVRGAPEVILKKCGGAGAEAEKFFAEQGRTGKRVLAIAAKEVPGFQLNKAAGEANLQFAGMLAFEDPIKRSAYEAISEAERLGVEIKILTGDSREVAQHVAGELKLISSGAKVLTGIDLDKLSRRQFEKAVFEHKVFARISPQQKLKIIEFLIKKKRTAFLGEGINDAPAIEAADVGMVLSTGADISKEVGDIILTHKDLKAVLLGINEGRRVFINVSKYLRYTLVSNFGNFFSIAVTSLILPYLPMLAIQILLVNLLSDLPHLAVATDNVDEDELAQPCRYDFRNIGASALGLGLVSSVFDFIFLAIFFTAAPIILRSLWFIESILSELLVFFSLRTKKFFLAAAQPSSWVTLGHLSVVILVLLFVFLPWSREVFHLEAPTANQLGIILSIVLLYFAGTEAAKLWYFRRFSK